MTDTTTLADTKALEAQEATASQESEAKVGGRGGACGGTGSCGGDGGHADGGHGDHAPEAHAAATDAEALDQADLAPATGGCGGDCACNAAPATPVLDARIIEPAIRQSAIFGVLVGMPPHASVVIVAPTDPTPIVDLLESRLPGEYSVANEKVAEDEFRVSFTRH